MEIAQIPKDVLIGVLSYVHALADDLDTLMLDETSNFKLCVSMRNKLEDVDKAITKYTEPNGSS